MVGLQPTKADIDLQAGSIARMMQLVMSNVDKFKYWLDAQTDPDLTALGYNAGDIANLRSAFGDLAQLKTIYQGVATLASVKDFRTFARRVWGLGDL